MQNAPRPREDWCPATGGHVHSFHDYSHWGEAHPKCSLCGYVDATRLPPKLSDCPRCDSATGCLRIACEWCEACATALCLVCKNLVCERHAHPAQSDYPTDDVRCGSCCKGQCGSRVCVEEAAE